MEEEREKYLMIGLVFWVMGLGVWGCFVNVYEGQVVELLQRDCVLSIGYMNLFQVEFLLYISIKNVFFIE